MIRVKHALAILVLSVAAGNATAGSGPNPFRDCGIGAALFPNSPTGAVISNVIWDAGTTAITSATASPETCSGSEAKAAALIYETYDSLVEETARGEGEYLASLLNILEIEQQERAEVISSIRQAHSKVVSSEGYTSLSQLEKSMQYYNDVMASISA